MAPKRKYPSRNGEDDTSRHSDDIQSQTNKESLANVSRGSVGKFLKKVNLRTSKDFNLQDHSYLQPNKPQSDTETSHSRDSEQNILIDDKEDELDDTEWEDGTIPNLNTEKEKEIKNNSIQVEFDVIPTPSKRKSIRRATAQEKEVAELVHKAHLLCLLGRGRLIDKACDDPLIQASLLSILPSYLLKIAEDSKLTSKALTPLVTWFNSNFRIRMRNDSEKSIHLALASTLETHEGTPEEVTALSVALFRALKLTTRFVSILDVVSIKPESDKSDSPSQSGIFNSSTLMVAESTHQNPSPAKTPLILDKKSPFSKARKSLKDTFNEIKTSPNNSKDKGLKRKGDLEYEMQLQMAVSATKVPKSPFHFSDNASSSSNLNPFTPNKRIKKIITEETVNLHGVSTAIGSKKIGAPLYWAEIYCNGENSTGKWVHIDAVNSIINGENKVESATLACKKLLRYVVAFNGQGAKDVTRRYCAKWYNIASQRVNTIWWDKVMSPLKNLESATISNNTINALEDMELETRALTEPLPTNQQAYKNHPLYAIERWLNKYQTLYPKGPVLGFCSGHPVFPRTCVQILHTKERWLREGLQVKDNETPAKILSRTQKNVKLEEGEEDECIQDNEKNIVLYGKWQTETLCLPQAINGIVPKNERGQVDVWSEKCLPHGTVHIRLPRLVGIVKRLKIDFAPAMVGFEFRNGRSLPVYEGLVVCEEFKDVILEAYYEEEEKREREERRRNEVQALSRWYQLISSIVTRQRLQNCYKDDGVVNDVPGKKSEEVKESDEVMDKRDVIVTEDHEHDFVLGDEVFDEGSTRTKRCYCGFEIQVEEL